MIEWKSQYSVENQRLDEQHQKLFELVNEILEAMKTEKSRDAVFIASVLKQLYEYTQYHFRSTNTRNIILDRKKIYLSEPVIRLSKNIFKRTGILPEK